MAELSNIDSYQETHIVNHGCACSICAQMIQRILWCYNGFCGFHWNHIHWILCSSGAIRLPAEDIRDDLTQTSHWICHNPGGRKIAYKYFFLILMFIFVSFSVFLITVLFKCYTLHTVHFVWTRSFYIAPWFELSSQTLVVNVFRMSLINYVHFIRQNGNKVKKYVNMTTWQRNVSRITDPFNFRPNKLFNERSVWRLLESLHDTLMNFM